MSGNPFKNWTAQMVDQHNRKFVKDAPEIIPDDAVDLESKLHYQILEECKKRRWIALHGSMAHKARRTPGEPDFCVLASEGRIFWLECKKKDGKLSADQRDLKYHANLLGHTIHVVRSMSEVKEIFNNPSIQTTK